VEYAAIEWLQAVGYDYLHGGDIAPEEPQAERTTYREVILRERAIRALMHINPQIPRAIRGEVIEGVVTRLEQVPSQNPIINNHHFHQQFVNGVDVSYRIKGEMVYDKVWLADFQNPLQNDWLAVNQFTVEHQNFRTQARTNRRPDIVLFMNGLPIGVVELKNASDENATVGHAFRQLQTYKDDIGSLFTFNGVLVVSDGLDARMGSLTAGWEWFKQWRTIDGYTIAPKGQAQLEILIRGALAPHVLLDLMRHFTVFDEGASPLVKKIAGYHQYHAVNKAVQKTIEASHINGDQRVGVVWHTQGSGKSLSMLFYAGKVVLHPDMKNPTLVVLTDRNDLDDQLFDTFAGGRELLRQDPVQAQDRNHLRDLLSVASGGVVFTTIQKFQPDEGNVYPTLSERRNIIFIADEAHRSQYGFDAKLVQRSTGVETTYGFAKYVRDALPHASFIGFTGTPVEANDANTPQVFGDYIDIYDIQRAVDDAATVPIYYEARLARIQLREDKRPQIDPSFEEVTEGQEDTYKEKLKTRWSQLEAMVGTEERLAQVARDMVTHFENRTETLAGKGMIVAMSRRIAVDLYRHIVELRPEWHTDDDDTGVIKVVMTGSASDPVHYQPHVRNKPRRKKLAERFKDPKDELR
jgi:type I restriction enzyme R subunit